MCIFYPFGYSNSLVLNQDDYGVGMLFQLRMIVTNELVCHIINIYGCNGCCVCFVVHEYATRENGNMLDGTTIPFSSLLCSKVLMRAVWCGTFIIIILVVQELSMIMMYSYVKIILQGTLSLLFQWVYYIILVHF